MKPVVLCFSGLDPTGGAGIQADIEAIRAVGGHTASIISCLTVQDTRNVQAMVPIDAELISRQADVIFNDMPVRVIKLGLIGSVEVALAIAEILQQHREIPVVLDPVLAAGGGNQLATQALIDILKSRIIPHCRLITPNIPEAQRLTGTDSDLPANLLLLGAQACLLTGSHGDTDDVNHVLIEKDRQQEWHYPRLPHEYHGSGCTLSASISAHLALELELTDAVKRGLDYTYHSLTQALPLGRGQWLPQR